MAESVCAPTPNPITAAQSAYLCKLINQVGKPAYLEARRRVDIPQEQTVLTLTKFQAYRLIDELKREAGDERF